MDRGRTVQQKKHVSACDANTTDGRPPMGETYIISSEDSSRVKTSLDREQDDKTSTDLSEDPDIPENDYYEWKNGLAIIINNEKFLGPHSTRHGTNCDERTLTQAFQKYNFTVTVLKDGTVEKIEDTLYSVREQTSYDCVAVVVLSHGDYGDTLQAYDDNYPKEMLWEMLNGTNCPHLKGKPKIVIIQACRGDKPSAPTPKTQTDSRPISKNEITLPVEADIVTSYSTYEGKVSYRNSDEGTWFIQALCLEMIKHGDTQDFITLLTKVNKTVAQQENKDRYNRVIGKQMPVIQSTLTKVLYMTGTKPGLEQQALAVVLQDHSEKLDQLLHLASRSTTTGTAPTFKPGVRWNSLKPPSTITKNNTLPDSATILKITKLLQEFLQDKMVTPQLKSDIAAYGSLLVNHVYYWECMETGDRSATYYSLVQFITTHAKVWRQYKNFDKFHFEDKNTSDARRNSGRSSKDAPEKQQGPSTLLPPKIIPKNEKSKK